jgi:hypothetical protein
MNVIKRVSDSGGLLADIVNELNVRKIKTRYDKSWTGARLYPFVANYTDLDISIVGDRANRKADKVAILKFIRKRAKKTRNAPHLAEQFAIEEFKTVTGKTWTQFNLSNYCTLHKVKFKRRTK